MQYVLFETQCAKELTKKLFNLGASTPHLVSAFVFSSL